MTIRARVVDSPEAAKTSEFPVMFTVAPGTLLNPTSPLVSMLGVAVKALLDEFHV